ncbi:TPA: hypothetical protein ACGTQW_004285 [Escherichia coli]|nr:hypothetical protein [Escherichia coli]HAV7542374.1 hypothetical protein [Escherichia coli]
MNNNFSNFITSKAPFNSNSNAIISTIYLYIRKNYLPSEKSNLVKIKKPKLTSLKLLIPFFSLLIKSKRDIYFKLNRANLADIPYLTTHSFDEKSKHITYRDFAYTFRSALALLLLPISIVTYFLMCIGFRDKLTLKDLKSISLAIGDIAFVSLVNLALNRNKNNITIYFSAAIIPDAAILMSHGRIKEVSHGVIHDGHPTYYLLTKRTIPIIVESEQQANKVISNGCGDIAIISPIFFKSFFTYKDDAPQVFIAQFGESYECEAASYLVDNPLVKVRFHPRNSAAFKNQFIHREYCGKEVSSLKSISSSMILDAKLNGIPYEIIFSKNESFESEFKHSREGLL